MNKKLYLLLLVVTTLVAPAMSAGQSSLLDRVKEEAKAEQKSVHCPLTEAQELKIYRYLQRVVYDFNSIAILQWGDKKEYPNSNGCFSIKLKFKGNTPIGTNVEVMNFFFDQHGELSVTGLDD